MKTSVKDLAGLEQLWFVDIIVKVHHTSSMTPEGCRIWHGPTKSRTRAGKIYGYLSIKLPRDEKRKNRYAHRLAFMAANNMLEADLGSLHVSHLCHNTLCVNKNHLSLESATVNNSRRECFRSGHCTGHGDKPDCILEA